MTILKNLRINPDALALIKKAAFWGLSLIYPSLCTFCGTPLEDEASDLLCCAECFENLPFRADFFESGFCAVMGSENIDGAVCPFMYSGKVKDALTALKFGDCPANAKFFANILCEKLFELCKSENISLVACVPLHPQRLKERGYNQAGEISLAAAEKLNLRDVSRFLSRTVNTKPQSNLNLQNRYKNVNNIFQYADNTFEKEKEGFASINKANILLVDDILTTGATVDQCAGALKNSGAGRVFAAVAAAGGNILRTRAY